MQESRWAKQQTLNVHPTMRVPRGNVKGPTWRGPHHARTLPSPIGLGAARAPGTPAHRSEMTREREPGYNAPAGTSDVGKEGFLVRPS